MALPPLLAGFVQLTLAERKPATAVTPVGAEGTEVGTTALEGGDGGLLPTAFVATTVKVYEVPLVSPITVALVAPLVTAVNPPGLEVTV
jgi:hypothetical protein